MTQELTAANSATNYFAVGHPSLTNYLEAMAGSNFGIGEDIWPIWNNGGCVDNAPSSGCGGAVPAIQGTGTDVATPATATSTNGSCNGQLSLTPSSPLVPNNCAAYNYAAAGYIGKSIADQLVEHRRSWKAYEESLPDVGSRVNGVNYSDGTFSNLTPASFWTSNTPTPSVPKLYAVKHNPFVYFNSVQEGTTPGLSEKQVVDFDENNGLFADLATGNVPSLSFIAPNQCHDIHSVNNSENICNENGPNIQVGDAEVKKIVTAIKASPAWSEGHNAIVILFDENDYADSTNVVPFIVDKNYGPKGVISTTIYDHFSLLRTLEAGFQLPCLNHACDATSVVINDLFADYPHGP